MTGEAIGKNLDPTYARQSISASLFSTSLEIGKALVDHGRATLYARGTCMYPNVRPGDILHLESRTVDELAVGDIAICRRPGYLFGHRTIGKRVENGRPCIITRSDTSTQGDDGPTFNEDLLGVVTTIERRSKRISPQLPQLSKAGQALLKIRRQLFIHQLSAARRWLACGVQYVQHIPGYRQVGRLWMSPDLAKTSYLVQLPLRAGQSHNLYHPLSADTFNLTQPTWQGRRPDCWNLALFLNGKQNPAAVATFTHSQQDAIDPRWQLSDLQIRIRYRGLGLKAALMCRAEQIFAHSGAVLQRGKALP